MLVLLDMSAAFDTIDHKIVVCWLSERCDISATNLKWFIPYLTNTTQSLIIGSRQSHRKSPKYAIPQESILDPLLFIIDTLPLGAIMKKHETDYQIYADHNAISGF